MKNLSCKYPKCVIIVKGNIHSQRRSHFAYWLMNVHNVMEEYVEKNVNGLYKNLMEEIEEQKEIYSVVQERMSHYDASKNDSRSSLRNN